MGCGNSSSVKSGKKKKHHIQKNENMRMTGNNGQNYKFDPAHLLRKAIQKQVAISRLIKLFKPGSKPVKKEEPQVVEEKSKLQVEEKKQPSQFQEDQEEDVGATRKDYMCSMQYTKPVKVLMRNVRTLETAPTLKKEGFMYVEQQTKVDYFAKDFKTQEDLYFAEMKQILLEQIPEATHIFMETAGYVRRNSKNDAAKQLKEVKKKMKKQSGKQSNQDDIDHINEILNSLENKFIGCAFNAHNDFNEETIKKLKTDENAKRDGYNYLLINTWRPITDYAIEECPFAVCDSQTTLNKNEWHNGLLEGWPLVTLKPEHVKKHKWYYYPKQNKNIVMLFCQWTNLPDYPQGCFHASFIDPKSSKDAKPRLSIDLRAFVILPK